MRHLNSILTLTFALTLLITATSLKADATGQLTALLNDVQTMTGEFQQQTLNELGDVVSESEGNLALRSGGRFRIETTSPFPQLLIADGDNFYTYDVDLAQVIVRRLVRDIQQVPILLFGDADPDFFKAYDITSVTEQDETRFSLKPLSQDGVFEHLILTFEGQRPTGIELNDSLDQRTVIELKQVMLNDPIADTRFQFTVPNGVDLIDDR